MAHKRPELTDTQKTALSVMESGGGVGEAAAKAGVDRVTLWRWRENPVFAQAWEEARIKASGELLSTAQDIVRIALVRIKNRIGVEAEWNKLSAQDQTDFLKFVMNSPYARRLAGDGAVQRTERREIHEVVWNRAPVALVDGDATRTYAPPPRALPDAEDAVVESIDERPSGLDDPDPARPEDVIPSA